MARAICTIEQGFHWGVIRFETSNATEAVAVKLLWKAVVVHIVHIQTTLAFSFPPQNLLEGLLHTKKEEAWSWAKGLFVDILQFS